MIYNVSVNQMFVINGRFLTRRITGVERYGREVTKRLVDRIRIIKPEGELRNGWGHYWEQVGLPRQLEPDEVLWSPANTGPLSVQNQVVTIHDVSVIDHPEWFNSAFAAWYRWLLPKLVARAAFVLAASSYSYIRLVHAFQICGEKIKVVPGGVDLSFFHPSIDEEQRKVRLKYSLSMPYILFVGTLEPRKNLAGLLRAWRRFSDEECGVELVIAGTTGAAFRHDPMNSIPPGVKSLGYVPNEDLPGLYSGAEVFVLPSRYEGFGLTALEAMACGTPVIASNEAALPEVVGNAGWLVDSKSSKNQEEEIVWAMRCLLEDTKLHEEFRKKGFERARQFSWDKTAQETLTVLEQVGSYVNQ